MTSQRETITSIIGATMSGTKLADNKITTSDNAELTLPTGGGELVTKDGAQTLTNKIYKATVIKSYNNQNYEGIQIERKDHPYNFKAYVPIIGNSVNNPVYLVAADSVATLTNKTLTAPVINNPTITNSNSNTITLPTSGGTLATTAITDDLANRINGMNPGRVFDTKAAMDTWLANSTNTATLNVGTNLYIRAVDVPDYWWDGTQAQKLETDKVDLTNIYTKAETNALIPTDYATANHNHDDTYARLEHTHSQYLTESAPTITNPTLKDSSTSYTLKVPTLSQNTTIVTAKDLAGYSPITHTHSGMVTTTGAHTLTNKTLTSPIINTPTITNPTLKDSSSPYTLTVPTLLQNTTIATARDLASYSLTSHTHAGMVTTTGTYTLTNKTLTNPTLKDSSTSYTLKVPTLTVNTTIATAIDLEGYSKTSHNHDSTYVKSSGDQAIGGVKTFSKTPVLDTNALSTANGTIISLPSNAGTLALTSQLTDFATKDGTQTLTNKTLTTPFLDDPQIFSIKTGTNGVYTLTLPSKTGTLALTSDLGSYSLTSHTHSGMVTTTGTQTLTNKTITNPTLKDSSTSYTLTVPTLSQNTTIATAKDLAGYSLTSHTHDGMVTTIGAQTILGVKTFSSAPKLSTNTITNSSGKTITLPSAAGTLATIAGTETLTNKTLTTPTIATIKNTNNITVPTVGGTMLTTSHVLVSKTLNTSITDVVETPANDYKTWFYVSYNTITKEFHCDFRVKNSSATSNHYPLNTWQTIGTCTAVKPAVTVYGLYEYNKNVNTNGDTNGQRIFLRYTNEGAVQVYNSSFNGWGAATTEGFHGSIHAVAI